MARGPNGEKRPDDPVGCAVTVAKIATGQLDETRESPVKRRAGAAGGKARAARLTPAERSAAARKAAQARWTAAPTRG